MVQCKILFGIGVILVVCGFIWVNYVLPEVKPAPESLNSGIYYAELWGLLVFWLGVVLLIISGIIVAYRRWQQ